MAGSSTCICCAQHYPPRLRTLSCLFVWLRVFCPKCKELTRPCWSRGPGDLRPTVSAPWHQSARASSSSRASHYGKQATQIIQRRVLHNVEYSSLNLLLPIFYIFSLVIIFAGILLLLYFYLRKLADSCNHQFLGFSGVPPKTHK